MNKEQIDALIEKYKNEFDPNSYRNFVKDTQYDNRSAQINYSMIREHKPKVVVEFGTKFGRCTHDIMQALLKNGGEFKFFPFEIDEGSRIKTQASMDNAFNNKAPKIGGDVMLADLPTNIEYLFLDHSHDTKMNNWVLDELIPKHCKPGCVVQIHDLRLSGDWEIEQCGWDEADILKERYLQGTLPLKKIYWLYEEGGRMESTWWKYQS